MDVLVGLNLMACGGLYALLALDYHARRRQKKEQEDLVGDLQKITKAVQESHNSLVDQVRKTGDRMAALEMGAMKR